jgi:acyl-coenzyme A synthetase/AMP-(fatty) acid ligase
MAVAPQDEENIGVALRRIAAEKGAAPAIVSSDQTVSYEQLERVSAGIASELLAAGQAPGRSTLLMAGGIDYILTFFGIIRAGNRAVPVESHFRGEQLRRIIASTSATLAIVDAGGVEALGTLSSPPPTREIGALVKSGAATSPGPLPSLPPSTELCVLFSSGSTGFPKGVVLTHEAGLGRAALMARVYGPGKRHLAFTPLAYAYGLIDGTLCPLLSGGQTVLLGSYNPARFKDMVARFHPQIILGVPFLYKHLASMAADLLSGLPAHKECLYYTTGEPLPRAVQQAFQKRYGLPIRQNYGLSEVSALAADLHDAEPRPSRVGKLVPGVELRFLEERDGRFVEAKVGEIWVMRSGRFMKGYIEGSEIVDGRMTPEHYRTGDIGRLDEEGYLELFGRNDDFMNVQGVRIHPAEVENVLLTLPGVLEAAFVCERNAETGDQTTRAYVVLDPDTAPSLGDLEGKLRAELPPTRWPQRIEVSAGLPRTDTGKLVRRRLAERADERLLAGAAVDVTLGPRRLGGRLLDVSRGWCTLSLDDELASGASLTLCPRGAPDLIIRGAVQKVTRGGEGWQVALGYDPALSVQTIERFIAARSS